MFSLQVSLTLCFVLSFAYGAPESPELEVMNWEPPEYLKTKYPYYLSGHDYDGAPVFVFEFGKWDFKAAVDGGPETTAELDKWMTHMTLRWRAAGNEAVGSGGSVVIGDGEGLDIKQLGDTRVIQLLLKQFPKFRQLAQVPGIKKVYAVNANYLFERVFELGKPALGEIANIVELYGTNAAKWKPLLLKTIPPEELPSWYGGSKNHKAVKVFG